MRVFLNANANNATAVTRWPSVESALRAKGYEFEVVTLQSPDELPARLKEAHEGGVRTVIAAGGDGTVNTLLNALMDPETDRPRYPLSFGAIGLGSSNDFHKPFSAEHFAARAPFCLDADGARMVDVGKAMIVNEHGDREIRYFLLNASMGITAAGNDRFNHAPALTRWLKTVNVELAIIATFIETFASYVSERLTLEIGDERLEKRIVNLGILKRPYFCGGMHYDTPVQVDDGLFDVNMCEDLGRMRVLSTVVNLYSGKFLGLPGTSHYRASKLRLSSPVPAPFETDGEVVRVREVELAVVPGVLSLCGR